MNLPSAPNEGKTEIRILHLEDSEPDHALLIRHLKKSGLTCLCQRVGCRDELTRALAQEKWDLVISDYSLGSFDGLDALELVRAGDLDLPFLMLSGNIGEELAAKAMKLGANDYLMKDNLSRLVPAIERELREAEMRREKKRVEQVLRTKEKELSHSQKMEALGRLAGGIAHDFNNLLAVISLNADSIASAGGFASKVEEIRQAVDRGSSLVKQLMTFSKRGVLPEEENASLNEVIAQMHPMLKRLIKKNIQVNIQLQEGLPMIRFVPSQVEQVLMNLVVNARDAIAEDGTIGIRTFQETRLDRNAEIERSYCVLEVNDSGCGMSEETQKRIFEPFFTTKGVGKGTGLGLSTVYGIMERADGMIKLESAPGKGTKFRLYFPLRENLLEVPEPAAPTESFVFRSVGTKILLVDDDGVYGSELAAHLNHAGCITVHAISAEVALLILAEKKFAPDLLLADLSLPGASGLKLAERAAGEFGLKRGLIISGTRLEAPIPSKVGEMELGFLRKPFALQAVLTLIDGPDDSAP